ncbi:MAG: SMI1/KNR4 family protein [Proteobacteria bacterium]|nr:MAG: SMI1/KNR4 family protein [Pseudomonadota bacterium]
MNRYYERVGELGGELSGKLRFDPPAIPTEVDLNNLEKVIGVSLPADYREFLKEFGGFDIGFEFYGVMPGKQLDLLDWHELYHRREIMVEELMPVAVNLGGNQLCIALSGENKGAIYFFILTEATVPASYDNCELVASSFDDLMYSDYLKF